MKDLLAIVVVAWLAFLVILVKLGMSWGYLSYDLVMTVAAVGFIARFLNTWFQGEAVASSD